MIFMWRIENLLLSLILTTMVLSCDVFSLGQETAPQGKSLLLQQAADLRPVLKSGLARTFLDSVEYLPKIEDREIFVAVDNRHRAVSAIAAKKLPSAELAKYEPKMLDENFYYFTHYGSPLAFVRPLEIVAAKTEFKTLKGKRIVDFGFGSIGHLRLLGARGADVTGIEVDLWLKALYREISDVSVVVRGDGSCTRHGRLELLFGKFPSELNDRVRGQVDLFVSKNTLKRGYIRPEKPVDPKKLVQLDVSDERFVTSVYNKLTVGGYFLIYNLHPAPAAEGKPYIPWADGRSPFSRKVFENAGFEVIAFDVDDTPAARRMAKALKWEKQMDLENDLFATYTMVKKIK